MATTHETSPRDEADKLAEWIFQNYVKPPPAKAAPFSEMRDRLRAWGRSVASSFQKRVGSWMQACFGEEFASDSTERNHRFLEEALELVQSLGCSDSEAHQLVDYVFSRAVGEPRQESGGVSVTHAALCLAAGIDMHEAAEAELARVWTCVEEIRAKQATKPKNSPLPQQSASPWCFDMEKAPEKFLAVTQSGKGERYDPPGVYEARRSTAKDADNRFVRTSDRHPSTVCWPTAWMPLPPLPTAREAGR